MRLVKILVYNRIVSKLFIFSIVFILFFSCFSFFYVDIISADPLDGIPPTINIKSPELDSIIFDKKPIITISFFDIDGINLDSIVFKLNNVDFTSAATISSQGIFFIPPSDLTFGSHTFFVSVSDVFNNTNYKNGLFTIAKSISSVEQSIGDINASYERNISINEGVVGQFIIYRIVLRSNNKLEDTSLFIANVSINSVGVVKPIISDTDLISFGAGYSITYTQNLFIYSYLNIELLSNGSGINESDINYVTIYFKVSKSWIDSNNVDVDGIRLLRYSGNGWQELGTTYGGEDTSFVYYSAITEGFSLFSLVGPELLIEQPQVEGGGINILLIIGVIIAVIVIIIAFLFWKGYLYIER